MPACPECGRDNPAGTVFCGYCATPLGKSPSDPSSAPRQGARSASPPPKSSKLEIRTPTFPAPPPTGGGPKGTSGFELIPWSELSSAQRAGRVGAAVAVLLLAFFLIRGMLHGLRGVGGETSESAPSPQSSEPPITDGDRKDGIESLCKVFQIYGLPKDDRAATEAAHNASELFKLAGNQSPERSAYILGSIVQEFRAGKLSATDCSQAGAPIPTNAEESPDSSSSPDAGENNNQ